MYKIWVRVKGSVSGTFGHYYNTRNGVWSSDCRLEAKKKVFKLYRQARKSPISNRYDFKIIEAY